MTLPRLPLVPVVVVVPHPEHTMVIAAITVTINDFMLYFLSWFSPALLPEIESVTGCKTVATGDGLF